MHYTIDDTTIECEGMCFDPSRVLTEIFTLEGAYIQTGMALEAIESDFYLQEVARTISIISLQCRQQLTSYFYQVPNALSATRKARIEHIAREYQSANEAISAISANLLCPKDGLNPIRFYDLIGKLCHVEKWVYPVQATVDAFDDDKTQYQGYHLLIHVTKRGKEPVSGEVEKIIVCIPWFIAAARVFITGCTECELYRPSSEESLEQEPVCSE